MCPSQRDARLFGSRLKGVRKTVTNSRCGSYRVGVDFHCPNVALKREGGRGSTFTFTRDLLRLHLRIANVNFTHASKKKKKRKKKKRKKNTRQWKSTL